MLIGFLSTTGCDDGPPLDSGWPECGESSPATLSILEPADDATVSVGETTNIRVRSSLTAMEEPRLDIYVLDSEGTSSSIDAAEGYGTDLTSAWSPRLPGDHEVWGYVYDLCLVDGRTEPQLHDAAHDTVIVHVRE